MVFHFNKKHLEDPSVPMWIIKAKGESYYVEHVECSVPWSTKETPDNSHTKGSIKVKDCLVTIDGENCASITVLTKHDIARLRNQERGITRIITAAGTKLREILEQGGIKHGPIKHIYGSCSSGFWITDILSREDAVMLAMLWSTNQYRVLMPNETYYRWYDDKEGTEIDEDAVDEADWEDLYES